MYISLACLGTSFENTEAALGIDGDQRCSLLPFISPLEKKSDLDCSCYAEILQNVGRITLGLSLPSKASISNTPSEKADCSGESVRADIDLDFNRAVGGSIAVDLLDDALNGTLESIAVLRF